MGNFPYNPSLPTYCSLDFGYRMPAAIWFQTNVVDGRNHIYCIDEFLHKRNVKTQDFAKYVRSKPYNVIAWFGDPAGKSVQGQSGLGDIEIFRKFGINIRSVKDKVSTNIVNGVTHVRGFIESANGNRYVHLHKKCTNLAVDLENYRYPDQKDGSDLKMQPLKDGYWDHGADAFRYFFINRFPIRNRKMVLGKR